MRAGELVPAVTGPNKRLVGAGALVREHWAGALDDELPVAITVIVVVEAEMSVEVTTRSFVVPTRYPTPAPAALPPPAKRRPPGSSCLRGWSRGMYSPALDCGQT